MNFYIYIAFGSKFRRELKRLLIKCKVNFYHCFCHKNFYKHDESTNPNISSNFEQFQLMYQNSPYPTSTTGGLAFGYKCKYSKALYI